MGQAIGAIAAPLVGVGSLIAANNMPKNTYQATAPEIQKQDLISQINALTPQQQELTKMLMSQSQGQGPNPAQIMLDQATNRATQQAAGQLASTRGISPALAARLAAQNGAAASQQAAGQGALMGAQQQIAAEGLLNQNLGQQQSTLQQAQANQNSAINTGSLGAQQINENVAKQNTQAATDAVGGAIKGISSSLTSSGTAGAGGAVSKWSGGEIPHYSEGGVTWDNFVDGVHQVFATPTPPPPRPETREEKYDRISRENHERSMGTREDYSGLAKGGPVKAMLSPGEVYIPPEKVLAARKGDPLKEGKRVPGKAKHKGDHPDNDTVPAVLEAGGEIIKRSAATSKDKAKAFMEEVAKQKQGEPEGFNRVLQAKQHLQAAHQALMKAHKAMKK